MLSRLKEHTFVGGKRVARQELPELPKDAVTTVHRVKVGLYGAKPPVWRRLEIPSAMPLKIVYSYDFGDDWRHDVVVEKIVPAEPGVAYPRCAGGRRDAPPEDCGGIWVFNEQFAEFGDLFTVGDLNERLAGLAAVLIPAR